VAKTFGRAMTDTTTYDGSNVFAKILRGEIPANRVYEDSHVVAFMDVMPQSPGHTLVVSRAASRNLLDADAETLTHILPVLQKIARAAKRAFGADGISVMQFNEAAGGQSVFHLHFHVIPRFTGIPLKPHTGTMEQGEILSANADKLRKALAEPA
jgi:histidine triad (HIT) family protein